MDTEALKIKLDAVINKIKRLEVNNSYLDAVSKSFHLGMVGGSGKNVHRLNKRKERSMDKSIEVAKELTKLYDERNSLEAQIKDIESGGPEKRKAIAADTNLRLVQYWKNLKAGDKVDIGANHPVTIIKKNAKSIDTESGCKWTAAEIIGRQAAALL